MRLKPKVVARLAGHDLLKPAFGHPSFASVKNLQILLVPFACRPRLESECARRYIRSGSFVGAQLQITPTLSAFFVE